MTLNPNQVRYPYSGGTDNPSEDTSLNNPGGPSSVASVETAPVTLSGSSLTAAIDRHPPLPAGIAQGGSDTVLPDGIKVVGQTAASIGAWGGRDRAADPEGGIDPVTGLPREAGQDETAGATETTTGVSPAAFPEPNP